MLSALCFSRNRPLQLDGYLRSLRAAADVTPAVAVLYTCDAPYEAAYAQLAGEHPDVRFVRERAFWQDVRAEVARAHTPLWLFGCDDVIFRRRFSVAAIAAACEARPALAGWSLRLGEEIRHCQPLGRDVRQPTFVDDAEARVWRFREAEGDWAPAFEVSATVYRVEWVRLILDALEARGRRSPGPNLLEAMGGKIAREEPEARRFQLLAASRASAASCLTINRVQEVVPYPTYEGPSPEELLARFLDGERLDLEAYAARTWDRIHIGDLFLRRR